MRYLQFIILFILLMPFYAFSQFHKVQWLVNKFRNADTILLASHELVEGSTDVIADHAGNWIRSKLLVRGKPNKKILKEQHTVRGKELEILIQILKRPSINSSTNQAGCFVPRQAIFLIKNNKTSFIDICFQCEHYETSEDLKNIPFFDIRRWTELRKYFIRLGFKYEMKNKG